MSPDPRATCIIGVARHTWHPDDADVVSAGGAAPEPLDMWERMARAAADDAAGATADATAAAGGGGAGIVGSLESIDVVFSQSWQYDDPASRLAERLGASPARRRYSGIGGSVPHVLATEVAREIRAGRLDLALLVGAEALATVRRLKKAGERPQWSYRPAEKRPFPMDMDFHPSEISHAVFEAYLTFALFDNARRARLGRGLDAHRAALGRLMAPMTAVAAASPHAWFPVARSAEEIVTATSDNRMVAYPYTKLMTAIMDVDMSAALVLASAERADALGVPEERRVYLRGWGYAEDPAHVAGHPELWRSPAMAAAARSALDGAGIGADDVAHLDLYSCFASSVCFALDALGIPEDDPRAGAVTQTGALPYHGGPGSNYMTHSLAAMVETLARRPGLLRSGERRRDAHAEARLRRVVDDAGRAATGRPAAVRRHRRTGRDRHAHRRDRPPSPPIPCCTGATGSRSGPSCSATCPGAGAATPSSTAGCRRWGRWRSTS